MDSSQSNFEIERLWLVLTYHQMMESCFKIKPSRQKHSIDDVHQRKSDSVVRNTNMELNIEDK